MIAKINNLKSCYASGLVIDDSLPIDQKILILETKKPGELVKIEWEVDGQIYYARAGNLDEQEIPYFRPSVPIKPTLIERIFNDTSQSTLKRFVSFTLLPDNSGFLRFESGWDRVDNCALLDAYGKARMRLRVPWWMTGAIHPTASQPPTSFDNVSAPYINPETGEQGKLGVTAHIADVFGCKFYFELDYYTGEFLWCKRIRD